jgi:nuclear pore complex protein Nup98-Nup96
MLISSDLAQLLHLLKINGLDFDYIEEDRLKVHELLAGTILSALLHSPFDLKMYLSLIMWY